MFLIEIYNLFNRFNVFFNILKNININSLIEFFNSLIEYMLHPMGGTPEPLKKTFSKISDVNYRTSEGEPSRPTVPRPSSPAVSESNDLYGSGGNSPEVSGAAGSNPEIRNNRPSNTSGRNSPQALGAGVSSEVAGTNSSVGSNSNVGVSSGLVGTSSSIGLGVSSGLVGTPSNIALGVGANTQFSGNSPLTSRLGVSSGVSSSIHANIYPRPLLPKGVIDSRLLGDYVASGNNPQVGNTTSNPSISIPEDPASPVVVRPKDLFEYRPVTSLFTNPQDVFVGTNNYYVRDTRNIVEIEAGSRRILFNNAINEAYDRLDIHCRHIPVDQKLYKLQPLIAEHIAKLSMYYQLTVSDVAELKYILSIGHHEQKGLDDKTQGLYSILPMNHGISVHTSLNLGGRSAKMKIRDDLLAIQAFVSNNNS